MGGAGLGRAGRCRPRRSPPADRGALSSVWRTRPAAGAPAGAHPRSRWVDGANCDNRLPTASLSATASRRRKYLNRASGSSPIRSRAANTTASIDSRNTALKSRSGASMRAAWAFFGGQARRICGGFVQKLKSAAKPYSGLPNRALQLADGPAARVSPLSRCVSSSTRAAVPEFSRPRAATPTRMRQRPLHRVRGGRTAAMLD